MCAEKSWNVASLRDMHYNALSLSRSLHSYLEARKEKKKKGRIGKQQ